MRCRNCHTGMMDTDTHCPSCHATAARAHAAAPGEMRKPPGMALLLPMFGGAIGGALYAGWVAAEACNSAGSSQTSRATGATRATGGSSPFRWVFGLLFV